MKMKWNEMSASEKSEVIVSIVLCALALVFIVLDAAGTWKNNCHLLVLSVLSVYECCMGWNKNRKMAILELVAAVFFAVTAFMG